MSSLVFLLLFSSLVDGVFGESVSVMEGDAVILHTDVTDVQSVSTIRWSFNNTRIAQLDIVNRKISTSTYDGPDGRFRDRLRLDNQTGSLTITNIRHAEDYKLEISSTSGSPSPKTFNINVIDGKSGGMKTVSVPMGESVILNTDKQTYDLIKWTFEADSLIAEINRAAQKLSTYDGTDGRFRGRLTLDHQTGSLNIRNIRTEHTGLYQAEIKSSSHTILKRFSVTVSDVKTESVMEGESVTLHTDLTDVQRDDHILWIFETEYSIIAEINRETNTSTTHDGPDERFRDRLQLNDQTGSLTITHIRSSDSGLYKLEMKSSRHTIHKRFTVTVTPPPLSPAAVAGIVVGVVGVLLLVAAVVFGVKYLRRDAKRIPMTVEEGDKVTLNTNVIKQNNQQIKWFVGKNTLIAELNEAGEISKYDDVLNGRFKHKLQLDPQTGSLIITDTRYTDKGFYKLQISDINTGKKIIKTFRVIVCDSKTEQMTVMKGESVTLKTGDDGIYEDEEIQWCFGAEEIPIAHFNRVTNKTLLDSGHDERFRGRLQPDDQTGDLTIKNMTLDHSGVYHLKISSSSGGSTSIKRLKITVIDTEWIPITVEKGDKVTLDTEFNTLTCLQIKWFVDDTLIAESNTAGRICQYDVLKGRFKHRLQLDQTGSVIITDTRHTDEGLYKLQISGLSENTGRKIIKTFRVFVYELKTLPVLRGDSVTLNTDDTEIQRDDVIEWRFGDEETLIAQFNRADNMTLLNGRHYERFRGRLKLDYQTITISNMTHRQSGVYHLKIISSSGLTSYKRFKITVIENHPPLSAQPALQAPPPASDSRNESTVIPMPEETPKSRNESDPLLNENHEETSSF